MRRLRLSITGSIDRAQAMHGCVATARGSAAWRRVAHGLPVDSIHRLKGS
jgi:hypothetical protein